MANTWDANGGSTHAPVTLWVVRAAVKHWMWKSEPWSNDRFGQSELRPAVLRKSGALLEAQNNVYLGSAGFRPALIGPSRNRVRIETLGPTTSSIGTRSSVAPALTSLPPRWTKRLGVAPALSSTPSSNANAVTVVLPKTVKDSKYWHKAIWAQTRATQMCSCMAPGCNRLLANVCRRARATLACSIVCAPRCAHLSEESRCCQGNNSEHGTKESGAPRMIGITNGWREAAAHFVPRYLAKSSIGTRNGAKSRTANGSVLRTKQKQKKVARLWKNGS